MSYSHEYFDAMVRKLLSFLKSGVEATEPSQRAARSEPASHQNSLGNKLIRVATNAVSSEGQLLYVSSTCVSNSDYLQYVRRGGRPPRVHPKNPHLRTWQGNECPDPMLNHPVIYVTQADARNFCLWLTRKEQQEGSLAHNETYTLPTLDQWVTLARGAPLTADAVIERRWIVGQYQPTEPVTWGSPHSYLGCYHVFGNVFEWCLDEWARQLRRPDKTVEVPYYLAVGGGWRSTGNGWKSHFGDRTTVPFGARMAGSCKTADSESGCWCGNEVASEWPTAATGKPSTSSSH